MNKIASIIFLISLSLQVFGQSPPTKWKKNPSEKKILKNSECLFRNTYLLKERLLFYPFNISDKIAIISFNDSIKTTHRILPIENRKLDKSKLLEIEILSNVQVDSLTNVMYNYDFRSKNGVKIIEQGMCYNPRNAIIFLDKNDKVFEYIGICFECGTKELSSEKIEDFKYCSEKYKLLEKYFNSIGIKIGRQ